MSYKNLNDWIRSLEQSRELMRIRVPVSPELEITEITDRVSKDHGKALLFEQVEGSPYPVFINGFGSLERMSRSLGAASLDAIAADIEALLSIQHLTSLKALIRFSPKLLRLLCCFPLHSRFPLRKPACQQVIEKTPNLYSLPILKCWPLDGGRFFTLPLVFTKEPDTGKPARSGRGQNCGMYRMQLLDETTTAMHWHKHKDGSGIFEACRRLGRRMPAAVALGPSPAVTYAATAPLPPGIDEMMLAGFLQRRPVRLVKCVTSDLFVPEESQFILEGYLDPSEAPVLEGPFGDHTGYYSLTDWYPRFHVTCLTRRKNPVFPATVVGQPPMEDCYMARATERIFLPLLRLAIPNLVNIHLPLEGVFHNCAVISVKNPWPGAARTAMYALWGMGQLRYTKLIIAVDETVEPCDREQVLEAVLHNTDMETDLFLTEGPLDALDHASPLPLYGARLGIDALAKKTASVQMNPRMRILPILKKAPFDGQRAAERALREDASKLTLVIDSETPSSDLSEVFWRVFNNTDPARDLYRKDGRLAVDATKKRLKEGLTRPWPQDIKMSREIKERVNRRWKEYGF